MGIYHGYSEMLNTPDALISRIERNLSEIDTELVYYIDFNNKIQINNLLAFVRESNERITKYEHIYPFIKEICTNQQINPLWIHKIEQALKWALKKGRGERNNMSEEIKDAWLTYIVILSCSMIDRDPKTSGQYSLEKNLQRLKENN